MKDSDCVQFLQWALPQLRMRWPGFRKVRKQACKRIDRRCQALGLPDVAAYRAYLAAHPAEWQILDTLCRISISRFYRDRGVFDQLASVVWPALAELTLTRGETELRCWSAGCASGEEPYTLSLIWRLRLQPAFPALTCRIIATDADERLLERAIAARYPASSLRELSPAWRQAAFSQQGEEYQLKAEFRQDVLFQHQDLRREQPAGPFQLILCRNLVLTYFEESLQRQVLNPIIERLHPGGGLVTGKTEDLPAGLSGLEPWLPKSGVYRRRI